MGRDGAHPSTIFHLLTPIFELMAPISLLSSHSLRHDFPDRFHALGCGISVNDGGAVARNFSGRKRSAFKNAFQNFFDPKSQAIGFGEALDLRLAVARPKNDGDLAEPVESLVVHFHGDDAFELREDFFNAVRQWMKMTQMNRSDFFPVLTRLFHRVVDRAVSRAPANEQRVSFLVYVNFRYRNFLSESAQLIAALCRHHHVQLRTAGGMTHFIVLESRQKRVFAVENPGAGRDMLGDGIDRGRCKSLAWREVRLRID